MNWQPFIFGGVASVTAEFGRYLIGKEFSDFLTRIEVANESATSHYVVLLHLSVWWSNHSRLFVYCMGAWMKAVDLLILNVKTYGDMAEKISITLRGSNVMPREMEISFLTKYV